MVRLHMGSSEDAFCRDGKQGVAIEDVFWLAHGPFPLPDPLAAPMFVLTFVIYQITMQS